MRADVAHSETGKGGFHDKHQRSGSRRTDGSDTAISAAGLTAREVPIRGSGEDGALEILHQPETIRGLSERRLTMPRKNRRKEIPIKKVKLETCRVVEIMDKFTHQDRDIYRGWIVAAAEWKEATK